ncbi:MAG: hypothetical protein WB507_09590, partial [Solirubrobacterales bacterium]
NPMLIWYSQEARGYALLVFLAALSFLFFVRALRTRDRRDLTLWALSSALALCSHYFAFISVSVEAVWLLVSFRSSWRQLVVPIGAVAAVGLALVPLLRVQANPAHIGWIHHLRLSGRILESAVGFLIGETGRVISEPPRTGYALIPALAVGTAFFLLAMRGTRREKQGAALCLVVAAAVWLLPLAAALAGKDYFEPRNLLPALVPLAVAASIGFAVNGAPRVGPILAAALCIYWLGFDLLVTQTPSLQRPDFRAIVERIGTPRVPRAIVTWKAGIDTVDFYLADGAQRLAAGGLRIKEVDVIGKSPSSGHRRSTLPSDFRLVERRKIARYTLSRYRSGGPRRVSFQRLDLLPTGFGRNAILIDGLRAQGRVPRYAALQESRLGTVREGALSPGLEGKLHDLRP